MTDTTGKPLGRCPECGADLIERVNSYTQTTFLGCGRYPECRYTREIPEDVRMRRAGAAPLPGFE